VMAECLACGVAPGGRVLEAREERVRRDCKQHDCWCCLETQKAAHPDAFPLLIPPGLSLRLGSAPADLSALKVGFLFHL
jgi:hypothetical protein